MSENVPKFKGMVKDGQFIPDRPKVYIPYLRAFDGKRVEVTVKIPEVNKTNSQLRYFHGVVCKYISADTGYTLDETKGLLKGHFLTKYITGPTGKEVPYVPSLADMKKMEMCKFIDDCISLAAGHWHIVVPSPDEVDY